MRRVVALAVAFILSFPAIPSAAVNPVQGIWIAGRVFCTVFSINEQQGYWASAAHCALAAQELEERYGTSVVIDGRPADVVYIDEWTDTAVFHADVHARAFRLARRRAEVGEEITIIGYPYGVTRVVTKGAVGATGIPIFHPTFSHLVISDILDITVAPGNSGSPILDKRGELVGVLWGGFVDSAHALGVPHDAVSRSVGSYFGR